jgi:DNA-binding beta-propeller fold protein YncE
MSTSHPLISKHQKPTLYLLTFVLTSALVMAGGPALGEAPRVPGAGGALWTERYSPGLASRSLAVSPDGTRIYVTGDAGHFGTVAYDAALGTQLWTASYDGGGIDDVAWAVAVSPDGSTVVVTGESDVSNQLDYATVAYDADSGEQRWAARYDGPAGLSDYPSAIGISPDGTRVFVTGTSSAGDAHTDYATVAYSVADGQQLWASRYTGSRTRVNHPYGLAVSPDGLTVYVTGNSFRSPRGYEAATVAYDVAGGTKRWVNRFNGRSGNGDDLAWAMAASPDGQYVFVTGCSGDQLDCFAAGSSADFATFAIATGAGHEIWRTRFDGPGHGYDSARSLAVSGDGSKVYVTGSSTGASDLDYAVVGYYASSGLPVWKAGYRGPPGSSDIPCCVKVSPDGSTVFVTGSSSLSYDLTDFATIALDASMGTGLWVARFDSEFHDYDSPFGLGVSPDSKSVYVTGESVEYGEGDYVTVGYSA